MAANLAESEAALSALNQENDAPLRAQPVMPPLKATALELRNLRKKNLLKMTLRTMRNQKLS